MKRQEQLWATKKYHVMFYSQKHYEQIRRMMCERCTIEALQQTIDEALRQSPTLGSQINTIQHMWGYFKKMATPDEKATYVTLLEKRDVRQLLDYIRTLADRYNVSYLQQSTILQQRLS